jgi:hypothetical protein
MDYNRDTFYDTLDNRNYEFDSGQDFQYWNEGNNFDLANRGQDSSDYFNSWDRNSGDSRWNDSIMMNLFNGGAPGVDQFDATGAYGAQVGAGLQARGQSMDFLNNAGAYANNLFGGGGFNNGNFQPGDYGTSPDVYGPPQPGY